MKQIEKVVLVESQVDDLWGLYADLRRADFAVRNVAKDTRGTYIYLENEEDKNPAPIVESWVGQVAPKPTLILRERRIKELKKIEEEQQKRLQAELEAERRKEEAREKAGGLIGSGETDEANRETQAESVGLLKRIFRKFF